MIREFKGQYRFLSNFYPCSIAYGGAVYPSVEHAFQAAKAISKVDRDYIRCQDTSGRAKRAGRSIAIRRDWESVKLGIMEELVRIKFEDNSDLAKMLIGTGNQKLVEGNTWEDTYWGVCRGKGSNHLGKILMKIRGELAQ